MTRTHSCIPTPHDTSPEPLLNNVGVVALIPDRWLDLCQVRHHVMRRLARYFHVVWADPPHEWREHWLVPPEEGVPRTERLHPNLTIYRRGRWLPKIYRPRFLGNLTNMLALRKARRELTARGCNKIILYVWRPDLGGALDILEHDLACYHIDDEYTFAEQEVDIAEPERALIARADQVFIHSKALMEKKGHLNPNTKLVPNGVDFNAYANKQPEPWDMREIPRPRIGYVGILKKQLDFDLLLTLGSTHPDWSFVLVGPTMTIGNKHEILESLHTLPNTHFLGTKSVDDLPAYTQHMDVCILSYERNDYTKYIYPIKLNEYLASGRPVVGTPIQSLTEFSDDIEIAGSAVEWSAAIERSLGAKARSQEAIERRQSLARQQDWDQIVQRIAETLCERIGNEYVERLQARLRIG